MTIHGRSSCCSSSSSICGRRTGASIVWLTPALWPTRASSIAAVAWNPGGPTDRRPPFKFSAYTRVGFSDTDAQGIVYYGRYLPYFDFARTEYLRHLGLLAVSSDDGHEFVMRALSVVYEAPARFDDLLEVFIRTRRIGRSSLTNDFCAVHEDGTLMCTAEQTLVLVDLAERRPVVVPEAIREAITAFEGPGMETAVAR